MRRIVSDHTKLARAKLSSPNTQDDCTEGERRLKFRSERPPPHGALGADLPVEPKHRKSQ